MTRTSSETSSAPPKISSYQTRRARAVARWYVRHHWGRGADAGTPQMLCDRALIGPFAVEPEALAGGTDDALFRALIAIAMYQRRQDVQIHAILRRTDPEAARELTDVGALLALTESAQCEHARTRSGLERDCDVKKGEGGIAACTRDPYAACFVKRHAELLRRWGYFGKVPACAALYLAERGGGLSALRAEALATARDEREAAVLLERALCGVWRVSKKIANLYLSALTNPDLMATPPWIEGVDWTWFVAIDSNVEAFLAAIGYDGASNYEAKRAFLRALAERVPLDELGAGLRRFNPRFVQQAIYLFMSKANRRALVHDCARRAPIPCRSCDQSLATICAFRAR